MQLARRFFLRSFILLFIAAQSGRAWAAAPTMMEIQQDFDAQHYQDVIKKIITVMQLKPEVAADYDKVKLESLKAESHLRLKQFIPAADAFTMLAKDSTDDKEITLAKATALLIRKSGGGSYQPKQSSVSTSDTSGSAKALPINIVEPESRKLALAALFNDEYKIAAPKVDALIKQQALPPLMSGIQQVADLRTIELAGTGSDDQSKQLILSLNRRAGQLMSSTLKSMGENVEKISKSANQTSQGIEPLPEGGSKIVTLKHGLNSNDTSALQEVIDTAKNILTACDELTKAMPGAAGNSLASANGEASKLAARAEQVLRGLRAGGGGRHCTIAGKPPRFAIHSWRV